MTELKHCQVQLKELCLEQIRYKNTRKNAGRVAHWSLLTEHLYPLDPQVLLGYHPAFDIFIPFINHVCQVFT